MNPLRTITIDSHVACRKCNSSDAATLYENTEDGSRFYKCYSCHASYRDKSPTRKEKETQRDLVKEQEVITEDTGGWTAFDKPYRGISKATLDKFQVTHDNNGVVRFPEKDYQGNLLAYTKRYPNKIFPTEHLVPKGFQNSGLWGGWLFAPGSARAITVTEGREDAMSAYELQGSKFPCVSLKNGTGFVLSNEDRKYLESFETIVYCGDEDEPGHKAAQKFATTFEKAKVKVVKLSRGKDANDYYQEIFRLRSTGDIAGAEELARLFVKEWWAAKPFSPEGLVQGRNTMDLFLDEKETPALPYPWVGLQNVLHGIRTSELVVLTAGSGVGKTAVVRELAHHIFKIAPNEKIGCIFLEESIKRTVKDFVGIELGVNLRLPENVVEKEKKRDAWVELFDNDRWIFWDHFGSNDIDTVCNQVRFIAKNFGAKYIFLDHISIIVSDGSSGDERKTLDAIMTKLRMLVQELDIGLFLVSHLRRSNDSTPHEEGGVTSLSQLRGSAGIGQLADIVIGLERNGQADNAIERNLTTLRILKNRFTGETGPACYVIWDKISGRLKEIENWQTVQQLIAEEEANYNKDMPITEAA